jgi:undecaprenyl phosphate-alpha-L-ara4FN deformylase
MGPPSTLSLKVDVCTHDGMKHGVPRLLELLKRHSVRASFFLSFGPDNSGKAVFNVFRPGFARKLAKSSALSTYGLRTALSGTLLPARPIATAFPDLVRRIEAQGHEVAVHAWDHRRWQDHLPEMDEEEIAGHFSRSFEAFEGILGHAPGACGAPAWFVTERSLRLQDELGLSYASDLRGGPACRLRSGKNLFRTPQLPTSGRCIEELLTEGLSEASALEAALLEDLASADNAVLAVHAEVEGGPFADFFDRLLPRLAERFGKPRTLREVVRDLAERELPVRALAHAAIPGRSGEVATSIEARNPA